MRVKLLKVIFDNKAVVDDQDQLQELLTYEPTEQDIRIVKDARIRFRKDHPKIQSYKGYVSGILKKLLLLRENLKAKKPALKHIEFLSLLGLSEAEIIYSLFQMGYRCLSAAQIRHYLKQTETRERLKKQKKEYMAEIDILKKQVFQEMASEVMEQEKKYLEGLIAKLPDLYKEMESLDPIMEPTKWNRVNKLITDILEKCKGMHGIDLYRENTVKAQAAIAVQNNVNKSGDLPPPLPMPKRHPELEEGKVIELDQERHIIGKKEVI